MDFEKIYDDSYTRVLEQKKEREAFFRAFYDRFLNTSKDAADRFKHTDMEKLLVMLKKSFFHLLAFYGSNQTDEYIDKIARAHDKHHHDVHPYMYDDWLDNLMATVADFDPEFNHDVDLAWRLVLTPGITYMKFKHQGTENISASD